MKKISILLLCIISIQFRKLKKELLQLSSVSIDCSRRPFCRYGDQGVATSADAFSQQYNPAKYAFSLDKQGFSISYTPYLSELVNDISLGQVNYFNRLNEQSAFLQVFAILV